MTEQIGLQAVLDTTNFQAGMSTYLKGLDKMNNETGKAAGKATAHFQSFGKSVLGATAVMGGAMVAAAGAAGVAVGGFVVGGIKAAANLEAQMSGIAAVLNTTREQIAPLKDLILQLGLDPTLKVSAEEAATAIENLARNGLSMTQILDGAARSTVLLANATGADFGTAADIATDAMALFSIKAEDMGTAVNGIVGVTNASKFSIDDYRLALAQSGAVANQAGVDFDDFNTIIAAISPQFASGSDAGTSFKTFLQNGLIPKSKEATAKMKQLGLMTANGSNQFYDANGNLKDFNDIAILLNQSLGGLSEEQQNAALTTLFGADASRAAIGIMKSGNVVYTDAATAARELGVSQEEVNKVIEGGITQFEALQLQMAKTDAQKQAEERNRNLNASWQILLDTIHTVQLAIGDQFLPILTRLTNWATQWVKTHSPAIIAVFTDLANAIPAVVGVITSLIQNGELLSAVEFNVSASTAAMIDGFFEFIFAVTDAAAAIQTFLEPITSAIASFVTWQDVLVTLGIAVASVVLPAIWGMITAIAPVIAVVGAVLLAVSALRNAWESDFLGIQTATLNAINAILPYWEPFVATITELAKGAIAFVSEHFNVLAGALIGLGAVLAGVQLAAWWSAASAAIAAAWPVIAGAIAAINWPLVLLAGSVALLGAAWAGNWFGIQEKTTAAISYILSALEPFTSAFSEHMQGALGEVRAWATGNETEFTHVKAIWDGAKTSAQTLFGDLTNYITTNFPVWYATLQTWGAAAAQWIADAIPIVTQKLTEWYTALTTYLSTNLPIWIANLTAWGYAAWSWIATATTEATAKIAEWYTALSTYVTTNLPAWQAQLALWATAAWQWIADATVQVGIKLGEWWNAILTFVVTNLPIWMATLANWGVIAWQWITDAAGLVVTKLGEWWIAIQGYVVQQLPLWQAQLVLWGTAAWQWAVDAATQVAVKLGEWWTAIQSYVIQHLPVWIANMQLWAVATWAWIVAASSQVGTALGAWWTAISTYATQQLTAWQQSLALWATAAWSWIVQAATQIRSKIVLWWTTLRTTLDNLRLQFFVQMLEWAAGLVTWVSNTAANALPELGKWLGKVLAWTIIGAVALVAAMVKFSVALVEWVTEATNQIIKKLGEWLGVIVQWLPRVLPIVIKLMSDFAKAFYEWVTTAITELPAKLAAWFGAFTKWVSDTAKSIKTKVVELATAFWSWLVVNPALIAQKFLAVATAISTGIAVIGTGLTNAAAEFAKSFLDTLTGAAKQAGYDIDFGKVGKTILDNIVNGWPSDLSEYLKKFTTMLKNGYDAIADVGKWKKAGQDIVQGIIDGVVAMKNTFLEKITGLATDAIDKAKAALGISSPSKVFMEIGRNVVLGYIQGIENTWDKYKGSIYQNLPGLGPLKLGELPNNLQKLTNLFQGLTGAAKTFVELSGNTLAGQRLSFLENSSSFLDAQFSLLEKIESLGVDPRRILGDIQLGTNTLNAHTLADIASQLAVMSQSKITDELATRQQAVLASYVLKPFTTWLGNQTQTLDTILTKTVSEFGQLRVDKMLAEIQKLDKQIADYTNLKGPIASDIQFKLAELLTQRARLIHQVGGISNMEDIFGIQTERQTIDLMGKQIDLLTQAKELGVAIPQDAWGNMADDSTLRSLTLVLANLQHTQAWQLQKQLDFLRNPAADPQAARLKTLEQQQAALDEQVELLGKVRQLGLQMSGEFDFGLGMTQGDLKNLQIRANESQLQRTLNELKLMERLSPELLNPVATSTGAQLYKSQVLDPMLKTLRETVMLESERVALIEQYKQKAAELSRIETKERQLEFLQKQNDMLNMIDDEFPGYIEAQIIAGTQFGINANIDDLLAVAERMTTALIQKVREDMGIASPSKVFMKIGQNVMAGFSRGIQSMAAQPLDAIRRTLRPLPYAMSGRALTMNMGGVTINSGMDEIMFESRVRQVVEGMI